MTFKNFGKMNDIEIQEILKRIDETTMAVSLVNTDEKAKEKVFGNFYHSKKGGGVMKRTELGFIAVIFGGLILALEIYGLKFMFLVERMSGLPWRVSASAYTEEPTVKLALFITAGVIIYGLFLIVQGRKSSTQ